MHAGQRHHGGRQLEGDRRVHRGGDQWDDPTSQTVSCDASGTKYVLGPAVFEGTALTAFGPGLQQNTTQWVVNLTLNSAATKAFGTLTTNQYNTYYAGAQGGNQDDAALDSTAIVLDGNVQEAPETQGALTSGQFTISGPQPNGFTEDQATQLTNILKYGSLPLNFTVQDVQSISPQVGHNSLDAGLLAGAIGLLLVIIYLFYYYRGLGIVSVSSLLIASLLAYLLGRPAQPVPELHHVAVGHRRPRGGDRHHRGLVHRLLRTAP